MAIQAQCSKVFLKNGSVTLNTIKWISNIYDYYLLKVLIERTQKTKTERKQYRHKESERDRERCNQ